MGLETRPGIAKPERAYRSQRWYCAYMAALFESDSTLIAHRIRLAELLIAAREGEMLTSQSDVPELRALNGARVALRALALCGKVTPS